MNAYSKAIVGGLILLVICFIFPPLFGEGYNSIKQVANGAPENITDNTTLFLRLGEHWGLIAFTAFIVLIKPIAAAVTIGAGGNGGNFAPSLFTGAYLGYFFSKLLNSTHGLKYPWAISALWVWQAC